MNPEKPNKKEASPPISRQERLLALLLLESTRGKSQQDQCLMLSRAGFSNAEVASLIGSSGAVVAQQLYLARSKGRKKGSSSE